MPDLKVGLANERGSPDDTESDSVVTAPADSAIATTTAAQLQIRIL
jgi:hypothetical protein